MTAAAYRAPESSGILEGHRRALLKVTAERIPDSQVLLNIEIDPDRVKSSLDQAYKRLAPRTRIPGFRPGKSTRS